MYINVTYLFHSSVFTSYRLICCRAIFICSLYYSLRGSTAFYLFLPDPFCTSTEAGLQSMINLRDLSNYQTPPLWEHSRAALILEFATLSRELGGSIPLCATSPFCKVVETLTFPNEKFQCPGYFYLVHGHHYVLSLNVTFSTILPTQGSRLVGRQLLDCVCFLPTLWSMMSSITSIFYENLSKEIFTTICQYLKTA